MKIKHLLHKNNFAVAAGGTLAAVVYGVAPGCRLHTAFLYDAEAGGIFHKITGCHAAKAHLPQRLQNGADGLRRIAMPLLVWGDDVADLDLIRLHAAVQDKADERPGPASPAKNTAEILAVLPRA